MYSFYLFSPFFSNIERHYSSLCRHSQVALGGAPQHRLYRAIVVGNDFAAGAAGKGHGTEQSFRELGFNSCVFS